MWPSANRVLSFPTAFPLYFVRLTIHPTLAAWGSTKYQGTPYIFGNYLGCLLDAIDLKCYHIFCIAQPVLRQ